MLVKVLGFGTNWWARFGRDSNDPHRYTRHAAYYNSSGIRCGNKVRRHWLIPGLIRFNGVSDFNPNYPNRSVGRTFVSSGPELGFGGNRLLFGKRADAAATPDYYLVVVSSELHGYVNFRCASWKSPAAQVIAASQLRNMQETIVLMTYGDYVETSCGQWQLSLPRKDSSVDTLELGATTILTGSTIKASCIPAHCL